MSGEQLVSDRIRESTEHQILFEKTANPILVTDEDGNYIMGNEAAFKFLECTHEELLSMNAKDMIPPGKESIIDKYVQVWEKGGTMEAEYYINGRTKTLLQAVTPSIWAGKHIVFSLGTDITERKRAEEALWETKEKFRNLVETTSDMIWEADERGVFTYMSPRIEEILGYKVNEVVGKKRTLDFMPREEKNNWFDRIKEITVKREPFTALEIVHLHKNGNLVVFETSGAPYFDCAGKYKGYIGINKDITRRKQLEEESKLLERRALLANRLASIGQMAAGIAHEINNPLTGVIGFSQLLMKMDVPEDIKEEIAIIHDSAQRVSSIVNRLLTFARQTKPLHNMTSINELLTNTLALRAYHLRTNNIEVTTELSSDLPQIIADAGQIQQVFLNIIVNAETEMTNANGKGTLLIKTEQMNNNIRISFKDNGPGMDEERLGKIFNPFFTTREIGQGTGLGLSICYGIVTEHNGKLWAESKPGKGSTFFIELPVITKDIEEASNYSVVEIPQKTNHTRILVIDDEQVILDFLNRVLTEEGYNIETEVDPEKILLKLQNSKYDLVLIDIKMPRINGIELYRQLKEIAPYLIGRVIFITGDTMGIDTRRFLAESKAHYITKPIDIDQLKGVIDRILSEN